MLCYGMVCYVMFGYRMLGYVLLYCVVLYCIMLCCFMLCYIDVKISCAALQFKINRKSMTNQRFNPYNFGLLWPNHS